MRVLIAVSLVSRVLHSFLKMAYADWINHLAGALAGALKGFALSAVLVALLGAIMGEAPFMRDSRMVPRIRDIVTQVKTHLPAPAFFRVRVSPHCSACCKAAFSVRRRCKANIALAVSWHSFAQCCPCRPKKFSFSRTVFS